MKKLAAIIASVFLMAHSWFPYECCHDGHCKEIIEWRTDSDGNWIFKTKETTISVRKNSMKIRPSQDTKRYICHEGSHVYCLFMPTEG
jgi:hypothetical protein